MKNRKRSRVVCLIVTTIFIFGSMLVGCGAKNVNPGNTAITQGSINETTSTTTQEAKLDPVDLTWYYGGTTQTDIQSVQDEMNKILKEKINATINLKYFDWGSYDQKMNVINAASENYDICFTASWQAINYYNNVAKGYYLPLDDLLAKYAPNTKAQIPDKIWNAAKIKGKIYGLINYQICAMTNGFTIQKRYVDKYGIDVSKINKFEDLTPVLDILKTKEKLDTPIQIDRTGLEQFLIVSFGFDEIGGRHSPGVASFTDSTCKVINQFDTPEYKAHFALMRDWYNKGYIKKDIAAISDISTLQKAGKVAIGMMGTYVPGTEAITKAANGGYDVLAVKLSKSYLTSSGCTASLNAISTNSKNPERSMMFLELINTDKQLYNLICFGIEGKHYTKISDDTVESVANSTYNPNTDWMFGNQFNGFFRKGQDPGVWDQTKQLNADATPSPLLGFSFDPSNIKNEAAQCQSVLDEYLPGLLTGTNDPDRKLPEFLDKLKAAGSDKIIAEKQRQIDEWLKTK